jgi:hypothetical protein
MKNAIKYYTILSVIVTACSSPSEQGAQIELTLIPPTTITDRVELDIRAGIKNCGTSSCVGSVSIFLNTTEREGLLFSDDVTVMPGSGECIAFRMNTEGKVGKNTVILQFREEGNVTEISKEIEIIHSDIRSTRMIDGAWAGLYHWSENEGKHWNRDIERLSDEQWREMVRSMHKLGMDIIVVQEMFRSEHWLTDKPVMEGAYDGRAFYPSELYEGRMQLAATDPLEAILTQADSLGMHVFPGVGLYAWFDFTPASLNWHKQVASELWAMYGHHPSFYGFYVSEEIHGSLDAVEPTEEARRLRKRQIVDFFREFEVHCRNLAPSKPIMLASNSMGVPAGLDTYPQLLRHLDILCPFGFARMPQGDLTGKEAADTLQKLCDDAGSHLWFDLEAFLFNPDGSLYPRNIEGIIGDLTLLDNFEKILCYQYPGVFSDPDATIRVGEEKTERLFYDYKSYITATD